MLDTLGAVLAMAVALAVLIGVLWRWVILPNLREQLFAPVEETRRQVSENRHANKRPTLLDRIDDVEMVLEAIGLNQQAILKSLGEHVGESTNDRAHLWLIIESLVHEQRTGRKQDGKERGNPGGA